MSLRSEAVEVIARQIHAQQIENTNFPIAWENCAHIYRVASRLKAESVLVVLLDFLVANPDLDPTYDRLEDVMAALRGTTEGKETK